MISLPTDSSSFPLSLSTPESAEQPVYELHLYVAGAAPRSQTALRNIETICQQHLAGRHLLTIVDLYQQPEKAGENEILGVPCLIKNRPGLVRRLVGDLSDREKVLRVLGLL